MADLLIQLQFFHFMRPLWLIVLPVLGVLWWRVRARAVAAPQRPAELAPHLAEALTIGQPARRRVLPIDVSVLALALLALAAAGPSWSRAPNPLVTQTAPLAVALEVSETMTQTDVAPSRLERGKQKILDIVAARAGARTALVAYAGTAHRVVPLTEDPLVLRPFLEGLSPEVMPQDGQNATRALALAAEALADEPASGAILFVTDDLDRADLPAFQAHLEAGGPPVVVLAVGATDDALSDLRRFPGVRLVEVTADRTDVDRVNRRVASAYAAALARDERQSWLDRGWVFALPAVLLLLVWIRRGVTMRWATPVAVGLIGLGAAEPARADGLRDWFLTPDQQGRMAFEEPDFSRAADLFEDPLWKGYALFRAGRYGEVAAVMSRLDTSEAAFLTGMAQARSREYRPAIASFELALQRDPSNTAAARNIEVTRAILAFVEGVREQSDTGEDTGIGADDVVFDNEEGRGADTQMPVETQMTLESEAQWMRSVDTRTGDFLANRFALEASRPQ